MDDRLPGKYLLETTLDSFLNAMDSLFKSRDETKRGWNEEAIV
ncbi:MAG: hypothetical protein U0T74_07570 [Chitinophagales bacterium]